MIFLQKKSPFLECNSVFSERPIFCRANLSLLKFCVSPELFPPQLLRLPKIVLSSSHHDRLNAPFAGLSDNVNAANEMDDNSLDTSAAQSTLNSLNSLQGENALLQNVIEKNMLAEAQEIIANLQPDTHNNNEFNDIVKNDPDSCLSSDDIDEFEDEISAIPDGSLFPERDVTFNFQAPPFVPNYLNMHYVCETGSRILLLSMCWFKKFHAFNLLR